jgi:CRP-like cAMP-binding protein
MLWYEADSADELALVVEGGLDIEVTGQRISELGPGELVGEAAAFVVGEKRTAAVRARVPSRLLILPQARLAALRQNSAGVYDLLLGARAARLRAPHRNHARAAGAGGRRGPAARARG